MGDETGRGAGPETLYTETLRGAQTPAHGSRDGIEMPEMASLSTDCVPRML